MLTSFQKLLRYFLNSGFPGGQYNTPTKLGLDFGEKISIKMLSMLQHRTWLIVVN